MRGTERIQAAWTALGTGGGETPGGGAAARPAPRLALAAAVAAALALTPARAGATSGEEIRHLHAADELLLRFTELPGEVASTEPLSLELWGDGRVVVTRPEWMRRPGRRELKLTAPELEVLLRRVASPALVDLDPERVEAEKRAARERAEREARERGESPVAFASSDHELTSLELNLLSYRGEDEPAEAARAVALSVRWSGLGHDLWEHGDHPSVRALGEARAAVRELLGRQELGR